MTEKRDPWAEDWDDQGGTLDSRGRPAGGETSLQVPAPRRTVAGRPPAPSRPSGFDLGLATLVVQIAILVVLIILAWGLVIGPWLDQLNTVQIAPHL